MGVERRIQGPFPRAHDVFPGLFLAKAVGAGHVPEILAGGDPGPRTRQRADMVGDPDPFVETSTRRS